MPDYIIDPNNNIQEIGAGYKTRTFLKWNVTETQIKDVPSHTLRNWAEVMGIPHSKAERLGRSQLEKCYSIENYFRVVKGDKPPRNPQNMPIPNAKRDWKSVKSMEDLLEGDDRSLERALTSANPLSNPGIPNPIPNLHPSSPDSVKTLLDAVSRDIDKRIGEFRSTLFDQLQSYENKNQERFTLLKSSITSEITFAFEQGSLDLRLSPTLEAKILGLVKKASDELAWNHLVNSRTEGAPGTLTNSEMLEVSSNASPDTSITEEVYAYIPKLDPHYHFDMGATKVIRAALTMRENLYVYGDTGCGKTTHLEQVCAVMGRGISRVNPHDGVTREMFLGGMKLIKGETKFIEGALPRAMKLGLIFLVDEISFLPPNLAALLNPVLESGGKLYIPETGEWISPHPQFSVFATDNTGGKGDRTGQYTGTEVQNTATLDRFAFCLKMDYLPREKEREMILKRFPEIQKQEHSTGEVDSLLSLAQDIRLAFSRGELALTLSTRKLIKFFEQRQYGFSLREALSNTLLSWLDEDDTTLVTTMIDRLGIELEKEEESFPTPPPISLTNFNPDALNTLINSGQKINAIKYLRSCVAPNTLGLKEAKDLVENYASGRISIDDVGSVVGYIPF